MVGWFGGIRPTPSIPAGDLAMSSSASHQDLANQATTLSDGAVTAVAGDGADGFSLTYTIGSDTYEVQLGADDFGSDPRPRFRRVYAERSGNRSFNLGDQTGSFVGTPIFSHFNVNGWAMVNWTSQTSASDFHTGYVVYGSPTDASAMPTGTATYGGRMYGGRQLPDTAGSSSRTHIRGALTLNADFDRGTVGGMMDHLEFDPPGPDSWRDATTSRLSIENGTITGNALAAEVRASTFEGEMEGHFFGPGAAEVGGTFQGTATDRAVIWGYFGGRKQ